MTPRRRRRRFMAALGALFYPIFGLMLGGILGKPHADLFYFFAVLGIVAGARSIWSMFVTPRTRVIAVAIYVPTTLIFLLGLVVLVLFLTMGDDHCISGFCFP